MFVSFTKSLIVHLLGSEDDIITFLGYNNNNKNSQKNYDD